MRSFNSHFHEISDFRRLYIFGAGGFGREVAWLAEQSRGDSTEIVFVVDQAEYLSTPINGVNVCLLAKLVAQSDARYVVALGSPTHRCRISKILDAQGISPAILIHPRSEMSRYIEVGIGSIVCAGVIATTNIIVGKHVHINLGCTIGHDVRIGNFSTLSPGVHVSGHVNIGDSVFIGTGATIINGAPDNPIVIGNGAVIAAGACVTRSVAAGSMVAGVPAIQK